MKAIEFIPQCPPELADIEITDLETRAQNTGPGHLFFAVKGYAADGHDYIDQALDNGAALVVAQRNPNNRDRVILVDDSRKAVAEISAAFFGHPSRDMVLVGITGTNGKTTTTYLLESIFTTAGHPTGVMGTINIRYPGHCSDNPITTPDALALQRALYQMKQAGVTHVAMEVSSHGLSMNRVDCLDFDAGIFTNLSQDHLDFHGDMESYYETKKSFFTQHLNRPGTPGIAVVNLDGGHGPELSQDLGRLSIPQIGVSHSLAADLQTRAIRDQITGITGKLIVQGTPVSLNTGLTGKFNLENILCAAGAAHALGFTPEQIRQGIKNCPTVPGRLERVPNPIHRHLFVDYAHTPDALDSILRTLTARAPRRVITVFGCGGDRDRTKRPPMGKIASQRSNIAIVTSDNPRTEDPDAIVQDILPGMEGQRLTPETAKSPDAPQGYLVEVDRRAALELAIEVSLPGDIIVAAGKGHEPYQITNPGTIHFDDKEELARAARKYAEKFTPIPWSAADLESALGSAPVLRGKGVEDEICFTGISTDSRTIESDQVFLALKGDAFDGHHFIPELMARGIKAFVVEEGFTNKPAAAEADCLFFETPDTLVALGQLGRFQRERADVKVLAITGSSGKTTTREMVQAVFSTHFETLATQGNYNNEIGVPQTLLKLSCAHEWAVIEMGMNHPGEMSRLSAIARPDMAMVTNTSGAHLEGLKTADNVAHAKAEIFESVRDKATAIIFRDDERYPILEAAAQSNSQVEQLLTFGDHDQADVRATRIEPGPGRTTRFQLEGCQDDFSCSIRSRAPFMVANALAAAASGMAADIPLQSIRDGLAEFEPVSGRMSLEILPNGTHILDDTYNANPASMTAGLKALALQADEAQGRAVAVLGDMLELGGASEELHAGIGRTAAQLKLTRIYLHGDAMEAAAQSAQDAGMAKEQIFHGSKEEIAEHLVRTLTPRDWVLFKGSRGMAMETVINTLKPQLTGKEDA